jgi:lipoprotein NlpI
VIRTLIAVLVAFVVMGQTEADPAALYDAGFKARTEGQNDEAIRLLSEAIATGKLNDDQRATAYNNRGMAYAATDQTDKAIADYSTAIKIAPVYGPAYLNRGNLLTKQHNPDAAIRDFTVALTLSPTYALAFNSRGAAYYLKHDLDDALKDFDAAINQDPAYGNAYWNRARVYLAKGDVDKGLADFTEALRYKPNDPDLHYEHGRALAGRGDSAAAMSELTAAIELNPKDATYYDTRGDGYFDTGQIDKAIADYDSAAKLAPDYPDPFTSRGRIELFHMNRPDIAARDLATGVRLDPQDVYAAIWLHIARNRSGNDDRKELAANSVRLGSGPWPRPVLDLFLSKGSPDTVLEAANRADDDRTRQEQVCEANFYAGIFDIEKNARDDARKLLTAAVGHCPADMLEKPAATAELGRL